MSTIEWVAAGVSLAAVILAVRRSMLTFPVGIVGACLYGWVFFGSALYGNAALQLYFVAVQLDGWRHWHRADQAEGQVRPRTLTARQALVSAALTLAAVVGIGWTLASATDSQAPVADAAMTGLSVAAQLLQARRFVENWPVWIVVNAIGALLFWSQDLYVTSGLYALFLALALVGWAGWSKAMKKPL
ncbi:MAG: nicotinamide riboside transporter PnuC [Alphaproteobacteria bacterium]|nr:nicotinamide riboside transporter PnuC [Alphaproteobacteria bacterium]